MLKSIEFSQPYGHKFDVVNTQLLFEGVSEGEEVEGN